jgi:hypothetical protein
MTERDSKELDKIVRDVERGFIYISITAVVLFSFILFKACEGNTAMAMNKSVKTTL